MSNIFLTGGSGLLGLNFYYQLKKKHKIFLNFHKKKIAKINFNKLDLNNYTQVKKFLIKNKIEYFIHTAAITDIEKCERNKKLTKFINVEMSELLARVCKDINIKFVFISSDQLFDGKKNFYKENDKILPLNYYSRSKTLAEKKILKINKYSLIVRTNFFGFGPKYRRSFSDWIIDSLKEKKKINIFKDVYFNPISINFLNNTLITLLKKNMFGIVNFSSDQKISKYEFALKIAKKFNLNSKLILPVSYLSIKKKLKLVSRPKNMTLSNKKLKNVLNTKYIDIDKMIKSLYLSRNSKNILSIKKIK